ncbi:MAG: hypothetical protein BWY19_00784 [bacterium ADurb.Bin212]|nr:MAG: hypothetical protein BWY19_00784 [bacterium ADurb.Bin212]
MGFPYKCPHCFSDRKWEAWHTITEKIRVIAIEYECGRKVEIEIVSGKSSQHIKRDCPAQRKRP